jgi:hypothetical protein
MRTLRRRAVRSGSVAIVIIATLVAVGMAAGDAVATSGPGDSVSGGFEDDFGERVGLHAKSGPSGENPSGHESATRPGGTRYRLNVTCLAVDGNLAAYSTVIVKSTNPSFPPGTQFVEVVRDGGLPQGEGDGWFIYDVPPADPNNCADFLDEAAAAPDILSGNIVVHDAQD